MNQVMSRGTRIKLGLFLLALGITIVPAVSGYGYGHDDGYFIDDFYQETWWNTDDVAWYQVVCYQHNEVTITVNLDFTENMSLVVYDPYDNQVGSDQDYNGSYFFVSFTCNLTGEHDIELRRDSSASNNQIAITVDGVRDDRLPGYSTWILLALGAGMTLAIAWKILKRYGLQEIK